MGGKNSGPGWQIETLEYPSCPGVPLLPAWEGWAEAEDRASATSVQPIEASEMSGEDHAAAVQRAFESGRERGRLEGNQAERDAYAASMAAEAERYKRQLGAIAMQFAEARDRYLNAVESEVVKLSLAVAARVLRREAQMDPLLLSGAVRVALGQLSATTEARMLVPPAELDLWREAIAHVPNLSLKPKVEAGEGMRPGDCMIESKVGNVDLGVRAQLAEIEHGFFDRAGTLVEPGESAIVQESAAVPAERSEEASP